MVVMSDIQFCWYEIGQFFNLDVKGGERDFQG